MRTRHRGGATLAAALILSGCSGATATAQLAHHARHAFEIRIAGTGRCVTASRYRAGSDVRGEKCRDLPRQQWVIGGGRVRLAGTRLCLVITGPESVAVLARSRTYRDDWRLGRHRLRSVYLSRRYGILILLTLPSRDTWPHRGDFRQFRASEIANGDPFGGYQHIRLRRIPAAAAS